MADLWKNLLSCISKRVNQQSFDTWFTPIQFHSQISNTINLRVPNEYFRNSLIERFSSVMREALLELNLADSHLSFLIDDGALKKGSPVGPPSTAEAQAELSAILNPKYTFETFVIGSSNQFAQAASRAVAERPAKAYNPLFIYGGVGLGKTHLMHSIGHFILTRNEHLRMVCLSAEKFTNDLINALRYDRTARFRETYRNIDILLMDDIHFLAGKERTQEEFFHTFNALYDSQKQIVITSDSPPKEIPTLEERLHSRFEWGLIADIQPPDLETKIAILKQKAAAENTILPDPVAFFIAQNIKSNIRELEGALIRLLAHSSLTDREIDLSLAQEVLPGISKGEKKIISTEMILNAVASHFQMKPAQLKSKNNSRSIAVPRQIAMYLCKEFTGKSLPSIGKAFGGKHHTTVLHSIRKVAADRKKDSALDELISTIAAQLH